jgi:hypothetical protein
MQDETSPQQGQPSALQSGPEVVASFIDELSTQTDLDQGTVSAIAQLYGAKRLSVTNLVKSLEELRGTTRV